MKLVKLELKLHSYRGYTMESHFYEQNAQYRKIQVIGQRKKESEFWKFFYNELSETEQDRTLSWMDHLADVPVLPKSRFAKLNEAIFELKPTDQVRVLGFHYKGSFVTTHGFYKKSRKAPQNQIDRADNYRRRFLNERKGR